MKVQLPTVPTPAANRPEPATSPAAGIDRSESSSFETALTRSRRDLRSRDAAAGDAPREAAPKKEMFAADKADAPEKAEESKENIDGDATEVDAVEAAPEPENAEVAEDAVEIVEVAGTTEPANESELTNGGTDEAVAEAIVDLVTADALASTMAVSIAEQSGTTPTVMTDNVDPLKATAVQTRAVAAAPVQTGKAHLTSQRHNPGAALDVSAETPTHPTATTEHAAPRSPVSAIASTIEGQPQPSTKPTGSVELAPVSQGASPQSIPSTDQAMAAAAPPPPTPTAPAAGGETVSALFAQQPQADESALRDDVNVGRVMRGINSAVNQRGGSVTLRLTPPELGAVRIDMSIRDGVVNARFTTQTESVRHLLTDQMSQLRQALDRQGLVVDKIEVQSMPQQSATGGFDRQMDDAGREGRSAGQYTPQRRDEGSPGEGGGRWRTSERDNDTFERALVDAAR